LIRDSATEKVALNQTSFFAFLTGLPSILNALQFIYVKGGKLNFFDLRLDALTIVNNYLSTGMRLYQAENDVLQ
jgi:hypothetical protein